MATPIRIKRSAVAGKRPTTEQLQLGELAVNFYDGKIFLKQDQGGVGIGTRIVEVGAGTTTFAGKTLYVTENGDDVNTGLDENNAKATIKAAVELAVPGDTVKVYPGTYVEDNPINLPDNVSIEGAELRRCLVSPQNLDTDLFYVSQGCHITNLSFVGEPMTNQSAVVSFRPLLGVSSDRYFDAARMIRLNIDFIAREAVGYLTSTDYKNPAFVVPTGDSTDCSDDVKDILRAICHDIIRGGNSKCVGAGESYYNAGALQHITGTDVNGYSVKEATIDTLNYTTGIVRSVINNVNWGGKDEGSQLVVTDALYDNTTGITTITTSGPHGLLKNNAAEIVGLAFTCDYDGGLTQVVFPRESDFGLIFPVRSVVGPNTFTFVGGISTTPHYYTSGGTVQKKVPYQTQYSQVRDLSIQADPATGFYDTINSCTNVVSAVNTCIGIVTTIIDVGPAAAGIVTNYPGNNGAINSGILDPSLSPLQGTGIITKGPYVRNCTNFIPNSIGAKIDGFNSDEGDKINNIGVQGSFNVDSYTQFNQGGIGVSVSNGAYCQLVSIFTICDDIAIYSGNGGQCDLTNSNSSFGTKGLVSQGIGDQNSKCSDRYTGEVSAPANQLQNIIEVGGLGNNRPYQGQAIYFDKKYYVIKDIKVTNRGSGYTTTPKVTIDAPTGPGIAIPSQATATLDGDGVSLITVFGGGSQYEVVPNVVIDPPSIGDDRATAEAEIEAIYFGVLEATEPVAGISTISLIQNLNNNIGIGTIAYFARQSFQIVSSHSFQYIGSGNTIEGAYPSKGGVTIQENEVVKLDGGEVTYTSTDQAGNFRIGDGVEINQATGTVSGNIYIKSLFTQVTPFILALGGD